jgi:hypothetical protein
MPSENEGVHPADGADEISPEVADLLDNPSNESKQPDKTGTEPADKSDDTKPEEGTEEKPEEGKAEKGKPEAGQPENPDNLNPDEQEYEVAGKKYQTFNEAREAIKRIACDNTRMAGELKTLQQQRDENETKFQEALKANKDWQEYFDNPEKNTAPPAVKQIVKEALAEEEEKKQTASLQKQYADEIETLPKEPDFNEVYPIFKGLAEELGDNIKKISPAKLFKMARGLLPSGEKTDDKKPIDELSKTIEKNIATKKEAAKVAGGGGGKANATMEEVSPEVADYFEQH